MRCANPSCTCESLYLREGGLYWINPDSNENWCGLDERTRKIIWLCPECSKHYVVETWRPPGEQIHARDFNAEMYESGVVTEKVEYAMAG